ncbi:MAG: FtsW/RodA/SpoVE family cell cycle protein [Planctomycetes bacterium]|nr:FtsW/RodA/SpoVE family cell cycle protein [Planctomycetota bacterium]
MARFRRRKGDPTPPTKEVQHGLWEAMSQRATGLVRRVAAPDPAQPAFIVLSCVLALFVIGFILQASHAATTRGIEGYEAEVIQQARYRTAALVCLLMGVRLGPQTFQRLVPYLFVLSLFLLIAVWIPGIAKPENGSHRWVDVFGFSFQASELARVALVLWTADRCARMGAERMSETRNLLPVVGVGILVCMLVFLEPDLGGSVVLMCCFFPTLWVGGASTTRALGPLLGLIGVGGAIAYSANEYVRSRVHIFLHGASEGQVSDAEAAIWSGGLTGEGLGNGLSRRLGFIHQETDYVFSLVGEELGLLGMLIVIGLFGCIAWFGLRMVLAIPDRFRALSAFGLLLCVLIPALVHMLVAVGLAPPKGMTLPFLSNGGTSLVMSSLACGLALGAARTRQSDSATTGSRWSPLDHLPQP